MQKKGTEPLSPLQRLANVYEGTADDIAEGHITDDDGVTEKEFRETAAKLRAQHEEWAKKTKKGNSRKGPEK